MSTISKTHSPAFERLQKQFSHFSDRHTDVFSDEEKKLIPAVDFFGNEDIVNTVENLCDNICSNAKGRVFNLNTNLGDSMIRALSLTAAVLNLPLRMMNCHRNMEVSEFIGDSPFIGGKITVNTNTAFIETISKGGILIIDDIQSIENNAEVLQFIHNFPFATIVDTNGIEYKVNPNAHIFFVSKKE